MQVYIQNYRSYDLEQMDKDDAKQWQDSLSSPAEWGPTLTAPTLTPRLPPISDERATPGVGHLIPDIFPQEPGATPSLSAPTLSPLTGNRSAVRHRASSGRTVANGVRVAELEGRPHYVVPVVMIAGNEREGMVMPGSGGPILYPPNETAKTVHLWNGRPIVRDHVYLHGISSANAPEAYSQQRVGTVFNARVDAGRLVAEAWIDIERAKAVDSRIIDAITNGRVLEVSTGVYIDRSMRSGSVGGRAYDGVAANYRPDHLAILPDTVGACSVKDGCGLLRNSASLPVLSQPTLC
jgi:hypothetical protein